VNSQTTPLRQAEQSTRAERYAALWRMSADERSAAMYRGELSFDQLAHWASQRPGEVPRLNGEFWFIAITCED